MTNKRFMIDKSNSWWDLIDTKEDTIIDGSLHFQSVIEQVCNLLNELHEENELLKYTLCAYKIDLRNCKNKCNQLTDENEQLKQDNNALIHLLENQSIIIQELHSKLLEYQVKEPIVLTKEDLNLMGKAISYYTHGRYGE